MEVHHTFIYLNFQKRLLFFFVLLLGLSVPVSAQLQEPFKEFWQVPASKLELTDDGGFAAVSSAPFGFKKVDVAGNIEFEIEFKGDANFGLDIQVLEDGYIFVSAISETFSDPSGLPSQPRFGGYDIWVVKVDKKGKIK